MKTIKVGSLFDGSGAAPFAAQICGAEPVWASEIEPFPILVTRKRFPDMKHLGDIARIDGSKIEPVDAIVFGSPCVDLSIAGNRKGLSGERSGLFIEAIRIIKEMRAATNGRYGNIAVWENVPGAFSSNSGEDFRIVLEEFCKIKDGNAVIPRPPKRKWSDAGEIVGDGYSVAWRVLDASGWGLPQRRRRIFLVADLRGGCAGEILFERAGLSRSFAQIRASQKGLSHPLAFDFATESKRNVMHPMVYDARGNGNGIICPNITGDHNNRITDYTAVVLIGGAWTAPALDASYYKGQGERAGIEREFLCYCIGNGQRKQAMFSDTCNTLSCMHDQQAILVTDINKAQISDLCHNCDKAEKNAATITLIPLEFVLRRLTPRECARLQGMPDWWTGDIEIKDPSEEDMIFWREVFETHRQVTDPNKKPKTDNQIRKFLKQPYSDSAEYKMWGNGMALPNILYVMEGVIESLKGE